MRPWRGRVEKQGGVMRRLIPVVAMLALLVPAAATAKSPAAGKSALNVARMCKDLRTANAALFKNTWGTNATRSNAYAKCVSAHARARHHGRTFTLHNVTLNSVGTVTSGGLTVTSAGTVSGGFLGSYLSSFTIQWLQATSNGAGGFCAPVTGTTTFTLPALGTLTKSEKGTLCEVGATGPAVEHAMTNGTFAVGGGTGVFAGATGGGTAAFDQKPGATNAVGGAVYHNETFTTLTIKR